MNNQLSRSIRQILLAGSVAAFSAGSSAAIIPGVQIVPPGPGQVPDYFGVSPNYTTSPTPNFALVTISPPNGTTALTPRQAVVAAATTTDDLNPNYALSPVGMYTNNLMDIQLIDGGAGYTNAAVTVAGMKAGVATSVSLTPITSS
jgi:hypothetical protein